MAPDRPDVPPEAETVWQRPPRPARADGTERRVGVEIEFAGVTEAEAVAIVRELWGGAETGGARYRHKVAGTKIGDVKVELDTALAEGAKGPVDTTLLDLSRALVPVEIVTPPIALADLPEIDRLVARLGAAGAAGSRDGALYAFGLHLNPEVAVETADHIVAVTRAYGLLEDWLRASDPPDPSRRVLPFVDPWPRAFVDRLAGEAADWALGDLREAYLRDVGSRNHGLDLLPLIEHLFPGSVDAALGQGTAKGGRPAWHFRLPESGIGRAGWSVAHEWNRWVLVEDVAEAPGLLRALAEGWQEHRSSLTTVRPDWARQADRIMREADIWRTADPASE
mgnify:FL=1